MDFVFLLLPGLLAFVAGSAIGCQSNSPEYSIGFYNDDPAMVTAGRVDWRIDGGDRHELMGRLAPAELAVSHSIQRPIPPTATVTWQTADGRTHSVKVDVAKNMADPRHFSGTVFFKILPAGTVRVVPLTYDEIRRLSYAQKDYP
jgi:hypothetical protein